MLSVKDSLLNQEIREKHQMCVLDFVGHEGIILILIDRSGIWLVCVFDVCLFIPFRLMT